MKQRANRRISRNVIGTLGASLLGNIVTGKRTIIACKGTIKPGENF